MRKCPVPRLVPSFGWMFDVDRAGVDVSFGSAVLREENGDVGVDLLDAIAIVQPFNRSTIRADSAGHAPFPPMSRFHVPRGAFLGNALVGTEPGKHRARSEPVPVREQGS